MVGWLPTNLRHALKSQSTEIYRTWPGGVGWEAATTCPFFWEVFVLKTNWRDFKRKIKLFDYFFFWRYSFGKHSCSHSDIFSVTFCGDENGSITLLNWKNHHTMQWSIQSQTPGTSQLIPQNIPRVLNKHHIGYSMIRISKTKLQELQEKKPLSVGQNRSMLALFSRPFSQHDLGYIGIWNRWWLHLQGTAVAWRWLDWFGDGMINFYIIPSGLADFYSNK